MFVIIYLLYVIKSVGIGDWGLGIAQSPIPNPQSPITDIKYKETN